MSAPVARTSDVTSPKMNFGAAILARSAAFWAVVIFGLALLMRLLFMSVPIDIDEGMWIRRGPLFFQALLTGNWPGTYLRHHPGVINMWLTGGALSLRYALRSLLPAGDIARQSAGLSAYLSVVAQATPGAPLWAYVTARIAGALVTSACLAGIYVLSRRVFGPAVALLAAAALLCEPFFLAYQRSITTDANQTNFTWLALLAFLIYGRMVICEGKARRWLALSGLFYGLAMLSKVSALLSLPVFGLWLAWVAWSTRARKLWLRLLGDLALWTLITAATAFALWPALWSDLPGTLSRLVTDLGEEIDGHYQFFLGQTTLAPGLGFYPVVLLFRVSPLLLLGSVLGTVALVRPRLRRYLTDRAALGMVLVDVVIVLLALTSRASKIDRYIVPVLPGLALLTAAGLWAAVCAWAARPASTGKSPPERPHPATSAHAGGAGGAAGQPERFLGGALAIVLVAQMAVLLPNYPVLLTYFNPLLGGPARAEQVLMVGNGEMLDRAAGWLNSQPAAERATAASWYTGAFAPYYRGQTVELIRNPGEERWALADAQYAVLYVNQFQREQPPQVTSYFGPQTPLYTVGAHGVDYAAVYAGPQVAGNQLPAGAQPVNLQFGDYARLAGYELPRQEVAAGEDAVIVLYWQPLVPFPAPDYHVYVGVRRGDGQILGVANNLPVGGMLSVDRWQPGQWIRDAQRVRILPGTPPGDYSLDIGFFSPKVGQDLPIRDDGGPRGTHVPLATLHVTRPARAPEDSADWEIAHRYPPNASPQVGPARLVGYETGKIDRLRAGDTMPITLLWQASGRDAFNTQLYLQLFDGLKVWQRALGHTRGGDYPASNWTAGELVRDAWDALLPADAPTGRYQIRLMANTAGRETYLLDLGVVDMPARDHNLKPPQPAFSQAAELGQLARLYGYDLSTEVQAGRPLTLTLYWQATGESNRNYVRFVHLLTPDNTIVAQNDRAPGGPDAPTTSWVPGEFMTDRSEINLPTGLPSGTYRLAVGLYDPVSGQRLTGHAGEDRIVLEQPLQIRGSAQ